MERAGNATRSSPSAPSSADARVLASLAIVLPVFGLIGVGYVARQTGLVTDRAGEGLSEFVFTLAVPCLIFRTLVQSRDPGRSALGLLDFLFRRRRRGLGSGDGWPAGGSSASAARRPWWPGSPPARPTRCWSASR